MQTKTIDGIKYIGVLEVPELSLQLPVMSHWSLELHQEDTKEVSTKEISSLQVIITEVISVD